MLKFTIHIYIHTHIYTYMSITLYIYIYPFIYIKPRDNEPSLQNQQRHFEGGGSTGNSTGDHAATPGPGGGSRKLEPAESSSQ